MDQRQGDVLKTLEDQLGVLEETIGMLPSTRPVARDLDKKLAVLEGQLKAELAKAGDKEWPPDDDALDLSGEDDNEDAEDEAEDDGQDDEDDDKDEADWRKAAPPPRTHKFETAVSRIAHRDGVSKAAAMVVARRENPKLFADYQTSGLVGHAANSGQPLTTFDMEKSAPSYRDLVAAEIRKGCSPTVAAQRVAYAFPELARQAIAKAAGPAEFMAKVDETMRSDGCSRTAAMSKVRKQFPVLFAKYQNV